MTKYFLTILIIFFCTPALPALSRNSESPRKSMQDVPWDTVIAELQAIETLKQTDSLKVVFTHQLFDRFRISIDDYTEFYRDFLQWELSRQIDFLSNVEKILLESLQKQRMYPTSAEAIPLPKEIREQLQKEKPPNPK